MSKNQSDFYCVLESLAECFKRNGIREIFGVVGDPITSLVAFAETRGIKYFGFRNEQAASYASSAVAFLTQRARTGVCLTVAGPGFVNALTGLANAHVNRWPNILVCPYVNEATAFQSIDQKNCLEPICKGYFVFDGHFDSVRSAVSLANTSPFGSVVIFVSTTVVVPQSLIPKNSIVTRKNSKLFSSDKTLVIIGGSVPLYPETFSAIRSLIENGFPFLADSMARGVVPETHLNCVSAARSKAFASCCSALIIGGRIDWMLSFGKPPKWNPQCKFILFSDDPIYPTDLEARVSLIPISGFASVAGMIQRPDSYWVDDLIATANANKNKHLKIISAISKKVLPSHHEAIGAIKKAIAYAGLGDALVVSEGANTMDAARVALDAIRSPCKRLDAGRWGTMGVGLGFVLAAHAIDPEAPVVCIEGDSAFGFSGMELETIVRYKCKAVIFVFNNGGIYTGAASNATAFSPHVKHDLIMRAFGGTAFSTEGRDAGTVQEIAVHAFSLLSKGTFPILVDVIIHPASGVLSGSVSRL